METLILSHLAVMSAFGVVFGLLQVFDREWHIPGEWTAMFFVLPVGMIITAYGEQLDSDPVRFAGLIGSFIGPILSLEGFRRFAGLVRPLRTLVGGFVLYATVSAAVVFVLHGLLPRLMLVVVYHMALGTWLFVIVKYLDPKDHALSRRIIQLLTSISVLGLAVLLSLLAVNPAAVPSEPTTIILIANWIAATIALTCLILVAERMSGFIRREGRTDPLTGLDSRRSFDLALAQEIGRSRRYGRSLALILFDIDRFKSVNDTYGHDVGDMVLQRVAECARHVLRPTDFLARLGGDEFAVLLPETGREEGVRAASRILSGMNALTIAVPGGEISIGGSFGVAGLEGVEDDGVSLIKRADLALYNVKRAGRNGVSDQPIEMVPAPAPA